MKRFFFLPLVFLFILASCDYVDVPQQAGGTTGPLTNDTVKRVLIEDFTGHLCINCPDAAIMLDSLENVFPGHIVGVGVHVDFWADPCPPHTNPLAPNAPPGSFAEDFRTPEFDSYGTFFDMSQWGFPTGFVNRQGNFVSQNGTSVSNWPTQVATILSEPMTAYVKINPSYNSSSRVLNVSVDGQFLADTSGTYGLTIYLVEDSIIGYQLDDNVPQGYQSNYVFNHVLRACINSPGSIIGDTVATGSAIQTGYTFHYPVMSTLSYTVPSSWNDAHLRLVAYLYKTSDLGVLQAAEAEVR